MYRITFVPFTSRQCMNANIHVKNMYLSVHAHIDMCMYVSYYLCAIRIQIEYDVCMHVSMYKMCM